MILNPYQAIQEGWITIPPNLLSEYYLNKIVQPNGIDFTLDSLKKVDVSSVATITESLREFLPASELSVEPDSSDHIRIARNQFYDGYSNFTVNLPANVSAFLYLRSTFTRVGAEISSGWFDSGYVGNIGFTLFSKSDINTQYGTRLGQIIFYESSSSKLYDGMYNKLQQGSWITNLITNQGDNNE